MRTDIVPGRGRRARGRVGRLSLRERNARRRKAVGWDELASPTAPGGGKWQREMRQDGETSFAWTNARCNSFASARLRSSIAAHRSLYEIHHRAGAGHRPNWPAVATRSGGARKFHDTRRVWTKRPDGGTRKLVPPYIAVAEQGDKRQAIDPRQYIRSRSQGPGLPNSPYPYAGWNLISRPLASWHSMERCSGETPSRPKICTRMPVSSSSFESSRRFLLFR